MGRNQQSKCGGYARNKGTQPSTGLESGNESKTVDAATALGIRLGLGVPQQNTMLSGLAGVGITQQTAVDSLFGSGGTDPLAGIAGSNTGLQSANGGNDLM